MSDFVAAGWDPSTVRRFCRARVIRRLRRGILACGPEPLTDRGRHREFAAAALLRIRRPAVVSHRSAALVWNLPIIGKPDSKVRVTVGRQTPHALDGLAVHVAQLSTADRALVDQLPVTALSRTLVDVARTEGLTAGVVAADAALNRATRLGADLARLHYNWDRALRAAAGWPGVTDARRARDLASPKAESPLESLLRIWANTMGIDLDLQVEITASGRRYRADAVVRGTRVIVECDGKIKYSADASGERSLFPSVSGQIWNDRQRDWRLAESGWIVVHVTWDEVVHHPERLRMRVLAAVARANQLAAG